MSVQYLAKAITDMRAVAEGEGIDWETAGEPESAGIDL